MSQHEHDVQHAARRQFDEAVGGLDADTAKRLRLMRREVLAGVQSATGRRWLPAAAFATALLALGLGWRMARPPVVAPATPADVALPAELAAEEDAALYAWLGEAPVAVDESPL
jgi:hypothetical protein